MMDDILNKYGKMTAADLVNETHKKARCGIRRQVKMDYWKHFKIMNATTLT